jgi:hypothetical protein
LSRTQAHGKDFIGMLTQQVPAPWSLTGDGYILVYRFSREFALQKGFIPPEQRESYRGGIGTVMLVNYHTSDAGPYGELLFIPGLFRFEGKSYYSITKIYVSTQISVENGWHNWAIPKEHAEFEFALQGNGSETVSVSLKGMPFFQMQLRSTGPGLPVNTAWLPVKATLAQPNEDNLLLTTPGGKGRIQLASIQQATINRDYFPDVTAFKPVIALRATRFQLTFPVAREVARR